MASLDVDGPEIEKRPADAAVDYPRSDLHSDDERNATTTPPPALPIWRLITLCVSLSLGLFLSLLDSSIVATALFSIGVEFKVAKSITWIVLAYTLTYLSFAVLFARFSDVVGRRLAYMAAFAVFFGFSIGCGFATNLSQLVACRALQGIGGSGLYSLTIVILPEISPPRLRPFMGSLIGMVVALAGILGPLLGGIITHGTTWRWIFWINGPVGLIAATLFCLSWPRADQMQHIKRHRWKSIDFAGALLLIAASVLVVFAFQEAGLSDSSHVWQSAIFLAPLLVGCLCWILLFGWEYTVSRLWTTVAPLMPIRLLRNRVYTCGVLCTITIGYVYFVVIYSLPTHFQVVNHQSSLIAGIGLLPMLIPAAIGSALGGVVSGKKKNRICETLVIAMGLLALGSGLLSTVSSLELEAKVFGFQVFVGLGFGLAVSSTSLLAMIECEVEDYAVAQGIMAEARILGGSIGIAASTAILGGTERRELSDVPTAVLASLQFGEDGLTAAQDLHIRLAYAHAFQEMMWVAAIVSCFGFIFVAGVWQRERRTMASISRPAVQPSSS